MHKHLSSAVVIGMRMVAIVAISAAFIGCASGTGPAQLTVSASDYDRAFDAAVEVARQASLIGGLRDRRSGIIETEPAYVPTMLEPWHAHREALDRLVESTVSFQRRRARFEFLPATEAEDLTTFHGDLELRVFVHVERMQIIGRRRSTWTRRVSSHEEILDERDEINPARRRWVAVGRDTAMEQRLLGSLQAVMHTP